MVRGLGEFKKANPQARCCQKKKPGAKKGLDILEMLKKRRRVLFYVSRRQVENLNGVLELKKKSSIEENQKSMVRYKKKAAIFREAISLSNPVIRWNEGQDLA